MPPIVAVLATLDTKGREAEYVRQQLEILGARGLLMDLGVVGEPAATADVSRQQVALAGGVSLDELLRNPTREAASPVMVRGATQILLDRVARGQLQAIIGLGGTQGTANCTQIMRALPYGFPKVMVSTIASGDTSALVDIKDILMLPAVADILGLNPLTRKILANAAGAAFGMTQVAVSLDTTRRDKPLIGMTNLGVLTEGAMVALREFERAGYEVLVFHAVGSGGRAMEQMMRDGIIGAVFDYALGEISDELYGGLRAGGADRLTVAGQLGLPQVLCPGGTEHIGLMVDPPHTIPARYRDHKHIFHNPIIFAPRLNQDEMVAVAREIARRLQHTRGKACLMLPRRGTSRYGREGMPLHDAAGDEAFFRELKARLPATIEIVERDADAEDPHFVREAVSRLIALVNQV